MLNEQGRTERSSSGQKSYNHRGQDRPSFHGNASLAFWNIRRFDEQHGHDHGITVLRDRAASDGAKDHKDTRGREPPLYVNVIRMAPNLKRGIGRPSRRSVFRPLVLLAAPGRLRILCFRFCGRPKTGPTSTMGQELASSGTKLVGRHEHRV